MNNKITWGRSGGYEVSSKGDGRFSALHARMPDGRTIEQWYQCDVKGYDVGGTNWKLGKGKPPIPAFTPEQLYALYKSLWQLWSLHNVTSMFLLKEAAKQNGNRLSDRFANTPINQARALSEILNEWYADD